MEKRYCRYKFFKEINKTKQKLANQFRILDQQLDNGNFEIVVVADEEEVFLKNHYFN
jgi:hypothetical protein